LLRRQGHRVHVVGDGRQAVEAASRRSFDLIFMDSQMPVMDGSEAARRIRETEGPGRRTPIVAITANLVMDDRPRFEAAGFDDLVTKPFKVETLLAAIEKWRRVPAPSGA
jgi:CheY-like chemotaxis protein